MAVRLSTSGDDDLDVNHEINVTPFIDVILVLLIIFMVAAPLSTVDVNVDLPASTAQPAQRPDKPLFLTIKSDLSLALGENPVARGQSWRGARRADAKRQGAAGFRARRQERPLWRRDGGDESFARRRAISRSASSASTRDLARARRAPQAPDTHS